MRDLVIFLKTFYHRFYDFTLVWYFWKKIIEVKYNCVQILFAQINKPLSNKHPFQ